MKALAIDLLAWQKRFGTEEACGEALAQQRWPEGFRCPRCGHDHGYAISTRQSYECSSCHYQASLTAGTLFHSTNLPLTKWFWAIYLMASDKGGVSALRLAKQIGVSWITAHRMLRKIRIAMGHPARMITKKVVELRSGLLVNKGEQAFVFQPFYHLVQSGPVYAIEQISMKDQKVFIVAGNNYSTQPYLGRLNNLHAQGILIDGSGAM